MSRWPGLRGINKFTDTDMEILKALVLAFVALLLLAGVVFLAAVIGALIEIANEENDTNNNQII